VRRKELLQRAQPQHGFCNCTGGHGTLPYEQNTQQSPGLGCSSNPQCVHSWKYTQALVGMVSMDE
jgi:hypothetical protein